MSNTVQICLILGFIDNPMSGKLAWISLFSYTAMSLTCIRHIEDSHFNVDVASITCHMQEYCDIFSDMLSCRANTREPTAEWTRLYKRLTPGGAAAWSPLEDQQNAAWTTGTLVPKPF